MFPKITHIEQILPSILGRKDFIHVIKDGYQVVDYVYEDGDSFDDPIRRECRGIKFDLKGKIIGRPFHKFFNYGQKLIQYDWSQPHRIMTKLDGSMVHSCIINNELRLCTRMGITDQSIMAEKYLTQRQKDWLYTMALHNYNVILEFTSPDNRIVIEYDQPKLTMLAVRNINDGNYFKAKYLDDVFEQVEEHHFEINDGNVEHLRQVTKGIEGFVVAWADGTYVKIKSDEYTQMHRAVSYFERENMILPLILDGQVDDILPNLSLDRQHRLIKFETYVMGEYHSWLNKIQTFHEVARYHHKWEKKDYAIAVLKQYPKEVSSAFFAIWDDKDYKQVLKQCIMRNPDKLLETRW